MTFLDGYVRAAAMCRELAGVSRNSAETKRRQGLELQAALDERVAQALDKVADALLDETGLTSPEDPTDPG